MGSKVAGGSISRVLKEPCTVEVAQGSDGSTSGLSKLDSPAPGSFWDFRSGSQGVRMAGAGGTTGSEREHVAWFSLDDEAHVVGMTAGEGGNAIRC